MRRQPWVAVALSAAESAILVADGTMSLGQGLLSVGQSVASAYIGYAAGGMTAAGNTFGTQVAGHALQSFGGAAISNFSLSDNGNFHFDTARFITSGIAGTAGGVVGGQFNNPLSKDIVKGSFNTAGNVAYNRLENGNYDGWQDTVRQGAISTTAGYLGGKLTGAVIPQGENWQYSSMLASSYVNYGLELGIGNLTGTNVRAETWDSLSNVNAWELVMDDMRAGGPGKFFDFLQNENPMTIMQDIMDEVPGEFDKSMNKLAETNPIPDRGDGFLNNVLDGIDFLAGKAKGIGKSIANDVTDMAKSAIKVGQSAINYVHHGVYEDAEQYTSRQQKLATLKKITKDMQSDDSLSASIKKKTEAQQLLAELSGMKHEKGTEGFFNEVTSAISDISAKQEAIDNRRAEQRNNTPIFNSYLKAIEAGGGPSTRATKNLDLERTGQLSDSIQKVDEHALALNPGYQYWDENGNSKLLVAFDNDGRELFNPKPELVAYYKDVSREMKDGQISLGESNTLTPSEAQSVMSNNKDSYEGWATYCNFVAGMVSENQGGPNFQQLNGVPQNANSIYDNLLNGRYDTNSYQLLEVPHTMAELHASNGGFAAGSWKNPEAGRSGHIVVLTGGYGDDGKPTSGNLNIYQGGSKYGNMLLKDGMSESKRNSTKYYILKNRNESWSSLWY